MDLEKMQHRMRRKAGTVAILIGCFMILAIVLSISSVFAAGGSIAIVNYYPKDQGTYASVNYFLYQTDAVNTNTTVSLSIDGGSAMPMICRGNESEAVPSDTAANDWYSWQTAVPAITAPGRHTFQFFSHYYVWQETDKYWAEFTAQTEIHSFTIESNESNLLASSDPIAPSSALPQLSVISEGALCAILAVAVVVIVASVAMERRGLRRNSLA